MRTFKWLTRLTGAALVGAHVWLLAAQWSAGRLSDPGLLIRWAVAFGLTGALVALYRSGATLFSRKSVVVWLLAALLHGPAVASRSGQLVNLNALPEAAATLVLETTFVAALALTARLIAGLLPVLRRTPAIPRAWFFVTFFGGITPLCDGFRNTVAARPPPTLA